MPFPPPQLPSYTYAIAAISLYLTYTLIPPKPLKDRLSKIEDEDNEVDNGIYDSETWWDGNCTLTLLNSARCPWFICAWVSHLDFDPGASAGKGSGRSDGNEIVSHIDGDGEGRDLSGFTFLDVGCGGGIATEELARSTGASFTGIDLSENSIKEAEQHCKDMDLKLQYVVGSAFDLPFPNDSLHGVICSDVLEHLNDVPKAVSEIARVLKPGGVFVYDTINRTWLSWFLAIVVTQKWLRFIPHGGHDWKLFITPAEMKIAFDRAGLIACPDDDVAGMRPGVPSPLGVVRGLWVGKGLQSVLGDFVLSRSNAVNYLAWARKPRH